MVFSTSAAIEHLPRSVFEAGIACFSKAEAVNNIDVTKPKRKQPIKPYLSKLLGARRAWNQCERDKGMLNRWSFNRECMATRERGKLGDALCKACLLSMYVCVSLLSLIGAKRKFLRP